MKLIIYKRSGVFYNNALVPKYYNWNKNISVLLKYLNHETFCIEIFILNIASLSAIHVF